MYPFIVPCFVDVSPVKFNCVLAGTASLFFFVGWWIMIALISESLIKEAVYILPGLFGTMALVVINMVPAGLINQGHLYADNTCCGTLMIKTCLLIGFMIAFGTLIGSCYILFNDFILEDEEQQKWPGYGIFLQSLFIFIATLLLRFRKSYDF